MLYLQTRRAPDVDWRNAYIIDSHRDPGIARRLLDAQRRQSREVNAHYPYPTSRIVEMLGDEIVRIVPLDPAQEPSDDELARLRTEAALRIAARYASRLATAHVGATL